MAVRNLKARKIATSNRRGNLFKKAAELSTLCGAQVAIVAISQKGKVSVFPNSDTVIRRYLARKGCAKKRADEKADVEKKELRNHAAREEGVIGHPLLDLNQTLALQFD